MRNEGGEELQRILTEHDRFTAHAIGKPWNGYRGMVFVNVLLNNLRDSAPDNAEYVKRAWVEDCSNEIDLLVVRKDSVPIGLSPAYHKSDVYCTIEVKASGVFWRLDEAGHQLESIARKLQSETGRPFAYVTRYENQKLAEITKKALGEGAFILTSGKAKTPRLHEEELPRLRRFVEKTCLRR